MRPPLPAWEGSSFQELRAQLQALCEEQGVDFDGINGYVEREDAAPEIVQVYKQALAAHAGRRVTRVLHSLRDRSGRSPRP